MTATTPSRLERVAHLSRDGQPWLVQLRTRPGARTRSGTLRNAFYEASGTGRGTVTVRHGRRGTGGQCKTYTYGEAWTKLHEKLATDYEYDDGTDQTVPVAAQPPRQRVQTLRDRLLNTTMRPITRQQLLDKAGKDGLQRVHADADYSDIYRGADAVSLLQGQNGVMVVVVRYGQELVWGVPKQG